MAAENNEIGPSRPLKRGERMTIEEASERYNIPMEILREYEGWGLCTI